MYCFCSWCSGWFSVSSGVGFWAFWAGKIREFDSAEKNPAREFFRGRLGGSTSASRLEEVEDSGVL